MSISLCMIVKNEEKFIERAISSVRPIVDEIIVVDTGSTDRTREIAIRLGARIFYMDWKSNFSEARNFSISKATKEWILVLDADELIGKGELEKLRSLTKTKEVDGFSFVQRNYSNDVNDVRFTPVKKSPESKEYNGYLKAVVTRLFRNKSSIRFSGEVHESVNKSIEEVKGAIADSGIHIHHYFGEKGRENLRQRQLDYLEISKQKLKSSPDEPKTHCDIALMSWELKKDMETAVRHFEKAIELAPGYENAYIGLGAAYAESGQFREAAELYKKIIGIKPTSYSAYYNLAEIFTAMGMLEDALREYKRCLKLSLQDEQNIKAKIKALESQIGGISYDFNVSVG